MERGTWNVECGTWNVERGTWNVVRGMWNVERGVETLVETRRVRFRCYAPKLGII